MFPAAASLAVLLFLPMIASAEVLAQVVGIFNIFVGVMLAIAFLIYVAGMITWAIRLGAYPSYRDEAIDMLKWPVAILFVLIVLLGIVQLVQNHLGAATFVLGVVIVLFLAWAILTIASGKSEDENAH